MEDPEVLSLTRGIRLEPDVYSRNKAVASCSFSPGTVLLSVPAWCMALVPSEKGHRCDGCAVRVGELLNCSGCRGNYWYCGTKCQRSDWKARHKHICRSYPGFVQSDAYQRLPPDVQVDATLLSHSVARLDTNEISPLEGGRSSSPTSVFFSLLPGPVSMSAAPPICPLNSRNLIPAKLVHEVYSRFGNNNFVIHSHLNPIGHGVFPLASRVFNHSCSPNAAPKYHLVPGEVPRMDITALREIREGEEIAICYLDPALPFQSRQEHLQAIYGFTCRCTRCSFESQLGHIPSPSHDPHESQQLTRALRAYVFPSGFHPGQAIGRSDYSDAYYRMPENLYPVLYQSFLPELSETFSRASHEGSYDVALDAGLTLLAFYLLIYPPNYPQIGLHTLEMAKTAWNAFISGDSVIPEAQLSQMTQWYLTYARAVLDVLGPEGDEGGPLEEVETLSRLLRELQ